MATDAQDRSRARERALGGRGAPPTGTGPLPGVRPEIRASWRRVHRNGLGPGDNPAVAPLTAVELEGRRALSWSW